MNIYTRVLRRLQALFRRSPSVQAGGAVGVGTAALPALPQSAATQSHAMLHAVALDFTAPLAAIRGYGELLRDLPCTLEEKERYARGVLLAADNMTRVVDDLLTLHSLPQMPSRCERINLSALVRQLAARLTPLAHMDGFAVRLDIPADVYIEADTAYLERALDIMVKTAVEHLPDDRILRLRITDLGDRARCEVVCHTTMDANSLWHTYQPNAQLDIGLGLPLAQALLAACSAPYGLQTDPLALWCELKKIQ